MHNNLDKMEDRHDPLRAGHRLWQASRIFRDLFYYLDEKSFGLEEIVFWSTPLETALYYVFKNINKDYMEQIIFPWVTEWAIRNERQECGLPNVMYLDDGKIKLYVPLTKMEQYFVKPWGRTSRGEDAFPYED